jgi:hypothetical protein
VFALLDATSSGMTLSHERCTSDMQWRQQITWCWLQKKTIVRQISAFKASIIRKLDKLENSALLEMGTVSRDSICQMEREESVLEKSVSFIEKNLQQLDFLTKNGSNQHVFLFWRSRLGRYFLGFHVFKRYKCNCTRCFL